MHTDHHHLELRSHFTNYLYTISVYIPNVEPPEQGFPIIYVLDGQSYFEFAKQTIKLQSKNTLKTFIPSSIVVAIHHQEDHNIERRFLEFTAPASQYVLPKHAQQKLQHIKNFGGAALFQRFMKEELKPLIEKNYAVDRDQQCLYGHSLAGYYTLWSYLQHSRDFQSYIAISPSLWWNNKELFDQLNVNTSTPSAALFLGVGEREGFMVDDASSFYDLLLEKHSKPSAIQFYIAPEENHASVVPASISRAFRFALQQQ